MKFKVYGIALMLFFINCSPKIYSLDECYEAHQNFQEELNIPFAEVALLTNVNETITEPAFNAQFINSEIIQGRTVLGLKDSPYKNTPFQARNTLSTASLKNFIENNHQLVEVIYIVYRYRDYLFQNSDFKIDEIEYLIKFNDDENLYYFEWGRTSFDDLPFLSEEAFNEIYKEVGAGKSDFIYPYKIVDEKYSREDKQKIAFTSMGYSKDTYIENLKSLKSITNEYSYFLSEHTECVDIDEFSNWPNALKILYSQVNAEINKLEENSEILYPSYIDWFNQ